jgi:plasmid stabilization system protein ParE
MSPEMSPLFWLTPRAHQDLDEIWNFIARDSIDAANRVESAILRACGIVATNPLIGRRRPDVTKRPVRFSVVTRYPNYIVVYRPDTKPIQIIAIVHGKRNIQRALEQVDDS